MPDPVAPQAQSPAPSPTPAPAPAPGAPPASSPTEPAAAPAGAARPEWLPEKFWQADKGAPNIEGLAKSYTEAQKLIGRRGDEVKAAARQEFEAELFGKRPATPAEYPVAAPAEAVDVQIFAGGPPEGFQPEPGKSYLALNPDSKALAALRTMAHKAGTSPEDFQSLLVEVARENGQRYPSEAELQQQREALWGQLGEHGQRRVQHLWGSLRTVLGDRAGALDGLVSDAKAVEALEELTARATGTRFSPPANVGGPSGGPLTANEIRKMQEDPKYWRDHDPAYIEQVQKAWKTLYPE